MVRREPSQSGGEARTEHPSGQAGQGTPRTDMPDAAWRRVRGQLWADLMRRTFGFDVLALAPMPGFALRWIWYLSVGTVFVQLILSLALLRREFARRLRWDSVAA